MRIALYSMASHGTLTRTDSGFLRPLSSQSPHVLSLVVPSVRSSSSPSSSTISLSSDGSGSCPPHITHHITSRHDIRPTTHQPCVPTPLPHAATTPPPNTSKQERGRSYLVPGVVWVIGVVEQVLARPTRRALEAVREELELAALGRVQREAATLTPGAFTANICLGRGRRGYEELGVVGMTVNSLLVFFSHTQHL